MSEKTKLKSTTFADLLPPLSTDEFNALKADIKANGVRDPVWIDEDGNVLDGRHRLKIDPKAPTRIAKGLTPAQKEAFVWRSNFATRNLSPEVKRELDAQRRLTAIRLRDEDELTQAAIAREIGADQTTVSRWLSKAKTDMHAHDSYNASVKIPAKARPLIAAEVASGKPQAQVAADYGVSQPRISNIVAAEKKRVENEALKKENVKAAKGLYDVLVIDPPWPMEMIEREVRPRQSETDYPRMSEVELAALRIPRKEDAHVWLWTTHRFLPLALRLLERWGLRYVCTFVWHKPGGFQPVGLPQYNCEFALYARCGSPTFSETKAFPVCFASPRGAHSEKPDAFYETVRRVTKGSRRLDMFNRREIEGFDGWGNQASS